MGEKRAGYSRMGGLIRVGRNTSAIGGAFRRVIESSNPFRDDPNKRSGYFGECSRRGLAHWLERYSTVVPGTATTARQNKFAGRKRPQSPPATSIPLAVSLGGGGHSAGSACSRLLRWLGWLRHAHLELLQYFRLKLFGARVYVLLRHDSIRGRRFRSSCHPGL